MFTSHSVLPDPRASLEIPWVQDIFSAFSRHLGARTPALDAEDATWSFTDLNRAAVAVAAALGPSIHGKTVAIYAERHANLVAAMLGIIRAGAAFVIIDSSYPIGRTLRCLQLAKPQAVINVSGGPLPLPIHRVVESSSRRMAIFDPGATKAGFLSAFRGAPGPNGHSHVIGSDLLYVAFTSGSTGFPKGVLGEHAPVAHFFAWQSKRFNLRPGDRFSVLSGLGHDPLLRDTLLPLWIGATACIPPRDSFSIPHRLYDWFLTSQITVCHLTPSLASLLLASKEAFEGRRLERLRYAFFGGEPLTATLAERFREIAPNTTLVNCYGATETPQVMAYHQVDLNETTRGGPLIPVGRGIGGVQILVMDEQMRLCEVGQEGQICVRTPSLAREVWDENGRPLPVFVQNPYTDVPSDRIYPTGDYGKYEPDGCVSFIGRRDKQVKIRGHRVELGEIERALSEESRCLAHHIDVQQTGAAGYRVVLYFVPPPQSSVESRKAIHDRLTQRLPDYMVPDRIVAVERLPLTPNGKVDVARLRAEGDKLADSISNIQDSPREAIELCKIISRQTGCRCVNPADLLTSHGLNSLQSVTLAYAIENEFGVSLAVGELARYSTILDLATAINRRKALPSHLPDTRSRAASPGSESTAAGTASSKGSRVERLFVLPRNERLFTALWNRFLQIIARLAPDSIRIKCHRLRGVSIGRGTSIGYDSIVETAYPWLVRIGDGVNIGMRVTIIAHFRGMAGLEKGKHTIDIADDVFVGPNVTILPNVSIGKGAVITAGSVVNASIAPATMAHGNPATPIARCGIPLSGDVEYSEFLRNLRPL